MYSHKHELLKHLHDKGHKENIIAEATERFWYFTYPRMKAGQTTFFFHNDLLPGQRFWLPLRSGVREHEIIIIRPSKLLSFAAVVLAEVLATKVSESTSRKREKYPHEIKHLRSNSEYNRVVSDIFKHHLSRADAITT